MSKILKSFGVVKLSKTSKLGTYSWSLQAFDKCPGAHIKNKVAQVCEGCYARTGMYRFGTVKKVRDDNWIAQKQDSFVSDFIKVMKGHTHFRFFDSGDLATKQLAEKIYTICKESPDTKFWIPTRSYLIPKINSVIEKIASLPNVTVRYSSNNYNEILDTSINNSVVSTEDLDNTFKCPAYIQDGQCLTCRACYDKDIKTIAYPLHGSSAIKKYKTIQLVKKD